LNNRIYLDYNSTSPFAKSVIDFLAKGDFAFENPASIHQGGKSALKVLNKIKDDLYSTFNVDKNSYDLIFHSGATEFINTFFQFAENDLFIYSPADHKAVLEQVNKAHHTYRIKLDKNGDFVIDDLKNAIKVHKDKFPQSKILVNYLWVHNETGVVWPLELIEELKQDNVFIHVDAVQSVGKILKWNRLLNGDVFTYSAHKFGALKGVGFSFIKNDTPIQPLILGGNQQRSRRAGTENVMGAQSIVEALKDVKYSEELVQFKLEIEKIIKSSKQYEIIGYGAKFGRNNNTINFIDHNNKADLNLIKFDMQGLDVSSGSACTAGAVDESHTLLSYGYMDYAKNGIRISLGVENLKVKDDIVNKIKTILNL
jgi:cysteine desulfurase